MLDRIIFGDNQFFGINHMSEDKAQALAEKFKDLKSIIEVMDIAYAPALGRLCSIRTKGLKKYATTSETILPGIAISSFILPCPMPTSMQTPWLKRVYSGR